MINGVINIYKEAGFTSHDVVAKMRGILKQKKIGHTGTLDPDATGVLPVCLGKGTKLCDMLTDTDKTYFAVMRLGIVTDTQDMSGEIIKSISEKEILESISEEDLRQTIEGFVGEYNQIPPMYSALKVNGKKLYELARAGIEVERKART
nr:tRNA pseudouridine(55) synthase TruB [Parasporobacterium sp.]